jgi:predicted 3-demethylubiquinone-9 3-methyltransferase (glyoxalase superfamily)
MKPITPCLWFDNEAEEAAKFYVSIFEDSGIGTISRYGKEGHEIHGRQEGTVMTVAFRLRGQEFTALNGGPPFKFNEAISFQIPCETQAEIDRFTAKLTDGGEQGPCGWVKDRFGLSWQIFPTALVEMLQDKDRTRAGRVMEAMLQMKKIEIAGLKRAYERKAA